MSILLDATLLSQLLRQLCGDLLVSNTCEIDAPSDIGAHYTIAQSNFSVSPRRWLIAETMFMYKLTLFFFYVPSPKTILLLIILHTRCIYFILSNCSSPKHPLTVESNHSNQSLIHECDVLAGTKFKNLGASLDHHHQYISTLEVLVVMLLVDMVTVVAVHDVKVTSTSCVWSAPPPRSRHRARRDVTTHQ